MNVESYVQKASADCIRDIYREEWGALIPRIIIKEYLEKTAKKFYAQAVKECAAKCNDGTESGEYYSKEILALSPEGAEEGKDETVR